MTIFGGAALIALIAIGQQVKQSKDDAAPHIGYVIVERWDIPAGGEGRVVVISPANRNEADLRAFGIELDKISSGDRFAHYEVFDDRAAAKQRSVGTVDKLPRTQQRVFDSHFLGTYTRNGSTGYRGMDIFPDGTDGRVVSVRY